MASPRREQVSVLDGDIATQVVRTGANLAKKHYVISLSWVLGLVVCMLGNGFTPSFQAVANYERTLESLPTQQLIAERSNMHYWDQKYRHSRGWFFTCDDICTKNYNHYMKAQSKFNKIEREYNEGVKDAKAAVGLFSSYGTEEVRNMFWGNFARGKDFAKRQTMWDAIWYGIGAMGRDEGIFEYALRIVLNLLMNFTIGVIMAFITFVFNLWSVITSYRPDFLTGLFFFGLATVAAGSFLVTWLLGLFAGTAGAVYVVGKVVLNNSIEASRRQGQPRYMQYGPPGAGYQGQPGTRSRFD